ncbi:DUF2889 domain-containing protein [Frankia sp. QA3]|uniref:DUF2889 domain-containing protein n=1 Tax=Frankia sp. QA3 TaxID=710111 RepID=UPI000269BD0E|nr:DUF2889 domain-containing protein [Frankia sp. QA3]EIV91345.1 Protein of unknown function (DUF2889) [Frankia sp. QA3]
MTAAVPVHRRTIDIEVCQVDDLLVAQARLRDTRPWHPDPARVLLHDMELALHVRTADLTIVAVESRMNAFPHTECPLIRPSFDRLVGLSVRRGFTRALRETVSGVHGCSHLHEIARAAGPAIIQATLSAADARRRGLTPGAEPPDRRQSPTDAETNDRRRPPTDVHPPEEPASTEGPVSTDGPASTDGATPNGPGTSAPVVSGRQAAALTGSCHIWAPDGIATRKLAAGWRPGFDPYPAPPLTAYEPS